MSLQEHIDVLVRSFEAHQDPKKAVNMSAYLKDHFSCYGIKSPVRNEIQKEWFLSIKNEQFNHWDVVAHLWNFEQREFHYVALDYLRKVPKKNFVKADYRILEELITSHSWWDSVDGLASNNVGTYFQVFPEMKNEVIANWRNSDNMWLNRTCLIFQLKYKDKVDFELLKSLIIQYQPVKEFFIQKAIGWSLRQYSKFNPEAVRNFVDEIQLQGLAKREAIKYL